MNGGYCSNMPQGPYKLSIWKFIKMGWEGFHQHTSFKVGDGSSIRFWLESWCDGPPLQDRFL